MVIKMNRKYFFTSESVTEGHPDKLCDHISDAVLDAYLQQDPDSRVACETAATTGMILVMGEISSKGTVDIPAVVRKTVADIGYNDDRFGFNSQNCAVLVSLDEQSGDIDMGVSNALEEKEKASMCAGCGQIGCSNAGTAETGAGDQGMMFGYACTETETLMPAPIDYAHKLCRQLSLVRREKILDYLGPDGKSMVTFAYEKGTPVSISDIVVSSQHLPDTDPEKIRKDIIANVIRPVIPEKYLTEATRILVNPTGRFVKGGPCADAGLTGRKIIVDTYGGMGRHGGGAFSGKDPTKVDRTGAYAARYVAKNIVAAGIANRCEVQISYAIGVANPVSIYIDTFGSSDYSDKQISQMVSDLFDLRPAALIAQFDLRNPIYQKLAAYGHMGREDLNAAWEKTDMAGEIAAYMKNVRDMSFSPLHPDNGIHTNLCSN